MGTLEAKQRCDPQPLDAPYLSVPPRATPQPHPSTSNAVLQLGTQLSLLLGSQFPHSVASRAVTPRPLQIPLCLLPLGQSVRLRGSAAAAGAQRCSAALSRETQTAPGESLSRRQNWELGASSWSLAGKRGFLALQRPSGAGRGSGNHNNHERHHGLWWKHRR